MKKIKVFLSAILVIFIIGCNQNDSSEITSELNELLSLESSVAAKQFIEKDEFIEVNLNDKSFSRESYSDYEIAKLKAVAYRFYKTVGVENGRYALPSASAKELKISNQLYDMLYENLISMNRNLEKLEEEGIRTDITEVNEAYLESLLD